MVPRTGSGPSKSASSRELAPVGPSLVQIRAWNAHFEASSRPRSGFWPVAGLPHVDLSLLCAHCRVPPNIVSNRKVAIKFCVEYGVLPLEQHQKMYKRYEKLKEKGAYNVQKQIQRALQRKSEKKLRKSLSAEALSAGRAPGAAAEAAK